MLHIIFGPTKTIPRLFLYALWPQPELRWLDQGEDDHGPCGGAQQGWAHQHAERGPSQNGKHHRRLILMLCRWIRPQTKKYIIIWAHLVILVQTFCVICCYFQLLCPPCGNFWQRGNSKWSILGTFSIAYSEQTLIQRIKTPYNQGYE